MSSNPQIETPADNKPALAAKPSPVIPIGSFWAEFDSSSDLIFYKLCAGPHGRAIGICVAKDSETGELSIWSIDARTYISPNDPHVALYQPRNLCTGHKASQIADYDEDHDANVVPSGDCKMCEAAFERATGANQ